MNPYVDTHFLSWFGVFFQRLLSGFTYLQHEPGTLFSDDIQAIVFALFAFNAAILGSLLYLKRLTMMANAISHTMVLGIVIAFYAFKSGFCSNGDGLDPNVIHPSESLLFVASTVVALVTSGLTQFLSRFRLIQEDAANAIVFSSLFALGITLVSTLTKNAHAGIELLMGNPDALHSGDIPQIAIATAISVVTIGIFFRGIFIALFDPLYGKVGGMNPSFMIMIVLMLVSITLVSSFRAVGFIMSLAFFVVPPLISKLFAPSLKKMIGLSISIGVLVALSSVALSRHLLTVHDMAVSTGALAVTVLACAYLFSILVYMGLRGSIFKKKFVVNQENP